MDKKAFLILQNGHVESGVRFGCDGDVTAELVFTTGMTGYLETLTDPSFHGQIVVQTFPLIGNYGVIPADFESEGPCLSGYVVNDLCALPSNFRSEGALSDYLKACGVIGISGVDTRRLTRMLRDYGVMNAAIVSELPADVPAFCAHLASLSLSSDVYAVTSKAPRVLAEGSPKVALWDFGYKKTIAEALIRRGCGVVTVPAGASAESLLALQPDGVLLSNGPGDPAAYTDIIREVRKVTESGVPVFGICLGHQLLALARGAHTEKLKFGHRGANQPVRDVTCGRLYTTSQNHGYAVSAPPEGAVTRFTNLNDGTNEGLTYTDIPAFSAQFHPEACAGPLDTSFLFDEFLSRMEVR